MSVDPITFEVLLHTSVRGKPKELEEALAPTAERLLEELRASAPEVGLAVGVKSEVTHLNGVCVSVVTNFVNGNLVNKVLFCIGPQLEIDERCAEIAARCSSEGLILFGNDPDAGGLN